MEKTNFLSFPQALFKSPESPIIKFINDGATPNYQEITAVMTTTVELKISTPQNIQFELIISQEVTKNLWHIKKYMDSYIAHLNGATTEEEFNEISKSFIKVKNVLSEDELRICCSYLYNLLPDIDLDDIALLLNIDFDILTSFVERQVNNGN